MNRRLALSAIMVLLMVQGCGGDTRESLAAEQVAASKDMLATLETVKDEDSAKAAKPKLQATITKMNEINQRESKLPAPTEAEMKVVIEKYGKQMEEIQQKMMSRMMAIQFDPKIQAVLSDLDVKPTK